MNRAAIGMIGLVVLGTLGFGCSNPVESDRVLVPGILEGFNEEYPQVSLVLDGTTLTVGVVSYGDGCRAKGELRVTDIAASHRITVEVFDWEDSHGPCPAILNSFEHSTTIQVVEDGAWTIVIAGHDEAEEPVQFEYNIEVGT